MGNSDSDSECSICSNTCTCSGTSSNNSPVDDTVSDPTFKCRVKNIKPRTATTRKRTRSGKSKAYVYKAYPIGKAHPISLSPVGATALSFPTKGKKASKI